MINLRPYYCPVCAGRNLRRPCQRRVFCFARYVIRYTFKTSPAHNALNRFDWRKP